MKVLKEFHHWIDMRITGKTARRVGEEDWELPLVEVAIEAAGLWPMWEYLRRRQATIVKYITSQLIFKLCTGTERIPGSIQSLSWWDQDHIREEGSN